MTLHLKVDKNEIEHAQYENMKNLRTVYGDRIGFLENDIEYEVFLTQATDEEVMRFGDYIHRIVQGIKLYES